MKLNLEELESDDDLIAPPYVTRCTKPKSNDQRGKEFSMLYPIFANLMADFSKHVGAK